MSVIAAALRSAVVPRGGAFNALQPFQLAAPVVKALLSQSGLVGQQVDQLIVANALGAGGNPARLVALESGLDHLSGLSIDTQCAGGVDAVSLACALVDAGAAQAVIAGGVESYSRRPLRAETFSDQRPPRFYTRPPFTPDPDSDVDMTAAAAVLARKYGLSRERQDSYAIDSHNKALAAEPRLRHEIVPINNVIADSYPRRLTPRLTSRVAELAESVSMVATAVEADGAAFCLVLSDALADRLECRFGLRLLGAQSLGADTRLPGYAPVKAIQQLFSRFPGVSPADCYSEMMEAYASQAMVCISESGLDPLKVNTGGGALARGHPIGASGAVLLCRLFHEMQHNGSSLGVCAIAAAGGLGSAMLLERREGAAAANDVG